MTILCVTTEGLPGIRPCTHYGEHRITCPDREVNRAIAEHEHGEAPAYTCHGCLPRKADRGFLCQRCYERMEAAYLAWAPFKRLILETGGRAVAADGGGIKSATPDGYTNLPLTTLALDECERYLRSRGDRTLDIWVHDREGAAAAIQFTHAAEHAYRSLEVEARELKLERVRCPHCGNLSLSRNPTRRKQGVTIVDCQWCGELLDKIRDDSDRWVGSDTCRSDDPLVHLHCDRVSCGCDCHLLGRNSQEAGISALWNADGHTWDPANTRREEWVIDDPMTIRRLDADQHERKTA